MRTIHVYEHGIKYTCSTEQFRQQYIVILVLSHYILFLAGHLLLAVYVPVLYRHGKFH